MLAGHLKQPRERQSRSGKGGQLAAAAKACQPQILERDCGGPGGGVGCAEDPQIFVLQDRCLPVGCRNAAGCHMCPPPSGSHVPPTVLWVHAPGQAWCEAHSIGTGTAEHNKHSTCGESQGLGAADPPPQGLVAPGGCRRTFGQPQFYFRKYGLTAKLVQWRAPWYPDTSIRANGQNASNLPVLRSGAQMIG